jgi:hypothetical protein
MELQGSLPSYKLQNSTGYYVNDDVSNDVNNQQDATNFSFINLF